jgi:hypothetical protein
MIRVDSQSDQNYVIISGTMQGKVHALEKQVQALESEKKRWLQQQLPQYSGPVAAASVTSLRAAVLPRASSASKKKKKKSRAVASKAINPSANARPSRKRNRSHKKHRSKSPKPRAGLIVGVGATATARGSDSGPAAAAAAAIADASSKRRCIDDGDSSESDDIF